VFFVIVMGQMLEMSSVVETPLINTNAQGNGKYAFECSAQLGQSSEAHIEMLLSCNYCNYLFPN
jgi:hypothetical protein